MFEEQFLGVLHDLKVGSEEKHEELAQYAAERAEQLAIAVYEPGYEEALIAARDSIALRAGIAAVEQADEVDRGVIGILAGMLSLAARIIADGA